jgi:flagellar hook assembly protein FlgD
MTTIRFAIPSPSPVDLKIYDVRGRLVKDVLNSAAGAMAPGMHEVRWDGRDNNRHKVASGVYFYRLSAGHLSATRKMVMLR